MAQIKIFGLKSSLDSHKLALSDSIHSAVVEAFSYPIDKKFHRFLALDKSDFIYPESRSKNYTIIEISIFEDRSIQAKKQLIKLIFENIDREVGIKPKDVEITIFETPKGNCGIRGKPGDELLIDYKDNV